MSLVETYVESTVFPEHSADSAARVTRLVWANAGQAPPAFTKASFSATTVGYVPPSAGGAVTDELGEAEEVVDASDVAPLQAARASAPAIKAMVDAVPFVFIFCFLPHFPVARL